jgi:hypothetical protein
MTSLVLIGPGLLDPEGFSFHVHMPDCDARHRRIYHKQEFRDEWESPYNFTSVEDVVRVAIGNEEIAASGKDWGEFEEQVKFFDCVPPLPLEESPEQVEDPDDELDESELEPIAPPPPPLEDPLPDPSTMIDLLLPKLGVDNIPLPDGGEFKPKGRGLQYRHTVTLAQAMVVAKDLVARKDELELLTRRTQDEWAELEAIRKALPRLHSQVGIR